MNSNHDNSRAASAPRSATCFWLNVLALAAGIAVFLVASSWRPGDGLISGVITAAVIAAIVAAGEVLLGRTRARPTSGLGATACTPVKLHDMTLRCAGLVATLFPFGAAYWLLPEYHGTFYLPYWRFLQWVGIPTLCLAPLYFAWAGRRVVTNDDPYLMLGRVLARQVAIGTAWPVLRVHFLGWTIKAFFLPLMVVYLGREAVAVGNAWRVVSADYMRLYQFCYELSIFVDLLFCVVGYTLTLRALDSHIRSVDPTTMGWVAALACYQPFYSIVGTYYLNYEGDLYWDNWLAPYPLLSACWGTAIIVLLAVYALSTVAFGLRFSNLTHRGIVTGGPYRFVRHPAYLSKNASWWLISVPFVSQAGSLEALRHCALLLLLNLLYVLRAWTEEQHLSRDPAYRDYSAWIARRGLFARLRRLMP